MSKPKQGLSLVEEKQILALINADPRMKATDLKVAMADLSLASSETGLMFAKVPTVAERAGVNRETVTIARSRLVACGYYSVVKASNGGRNRPNVYRCVKPWKIKRKKPKPPEQPRVRPKNVKTAGIAAQTAGISEGHLSDLYIGKKPTVFSSPVDTPSATETQYSEAIARAYGARSLSKTEQVSTSPNAVGDISALVEEPPPHDRIPDGPDEELPPDDLTRSEKVDPETRNGVHDDCTAFMEKGDGVEPSERTRAVLAELGEEEGFFDCWAVLELSRWLTRNGDPAGEEIEAAMQARIDVIDTEWADDDC